MKLPTPQVMDTEQFHTVMTVRYNNAGLPFFARLHAEDVMRLRKMRAKTYLLEQQVKVNAIQKALKQIEAMLG